MELFSKKIVNVYLDEYIIFFTKRNLLCFCEFFELSEINRTNIQTEICPFAILESNAITDMSQNFRVRISEGLWYMFSI